MIQRMLKITSIEEIKPAKNERAYRVVRFTTFNILPDGTPVFSNQGLGTRTIFGPFVDKDGNSYKADGLWTDIAEGRAKVGSLVEGHIAKVSTYPYQIEDSEFEAKSYSAVIFSNENEVDYCNKQLKEYYSCVLIGDHLTAPEQLQRPVVAGPGKLVIAGPSELNP